MKKILFVMPGLQVGGLEKMQVNIANALAEKGYDVTILMLNDQRQLEKYLLHSIKLVYKPPKNKLLRRLPYFGNKYYDDGLWETRATPKKLHKYYVGKQKFDVEVGFFRGTSVKIVSGCTSKETVKLAWVHNDFKKVSGYLNQFKNKEQVFEAYRSFNKVVCVSKQAEMAFIDVIGDTKNTTNIYNLLNVSKVIEQSLEKPKFELSGNKFKCVIVGRLADDQKGQIRLIHSIKSLQDDGCNIGLTIVGGGVDRENIENQIRSLNAGKYIQMVGEQDNPYPYIKNADLLVCASYFEGYNLTVAEALVIGTPVLSTNCTGPAEILDGGKYGMIVDNSIDGITQGLRRLYDDRELLLHYKKMTTERKDFFSQERILEQIEKLF